MKFLIVCVYIMCLNVYPSCGIREGNVKFTFTWSDGRKFMFNEICTNIYQKDRLYIQGASETHRSNCFVILIKEIDA